MNTQINTRICGIPCLVRAEVVVVKGSHSYNAPSDLDYYGYEDVEDIEICDQRGRPAPWLERKMSDRDHRELEADLIAARCDELKEMEYDR